MDIVFEFIDLMNRTKRMKFFEIPNLGAGFTIAQMRIVGFLHRSGSSRTQDIANGLDISAPTASVSINKLVDAGWLEKSPDPKDGRATLISIASKTKKTFMKMRKKRIEGVKESLSVLTQEEQKTLLSFLSRIADNFEKR